MVVECECACVYMYMHLQYFSSLTLTNGLAVIHNFSAVRSPAAMGQAVVVGCVCFCDSLRCQDSYWHGTFVAIMLLRLFFVAD